MGEVNKTMVALDCGNSSYRVVLGRYRDGKIESTVIKQIPNGMEKVGEYYYWDIRKIFDGFIETLKVLLTVVKKSILSEFVHGELILPCLIRMAR